MFKYLRQNNFIQQNDKIPYQAQINSGKAFVHTFSQQRGNVVVTEQKTFLTWDGLEWLVDKLIKDGYSLNTTPQAVWDNYSENPVK